MRRCLAGRSHVLASFSVMNAFLTCDAKMSSGCVSCDDPNSAGFEAEPPGLRSLGRGKEILQSLREEQAGGRERRTK